MKVYLFLIATLVTIAAACKKNDTKTAVCRISKITNPGGEEIKISYDDNGNYSKIENGETKETSIAVYRPGAVTYTITNSLAGTRIVITISLNAAGIATSSQKEIYDPTGALTTLITTVYDYSGTELIKSTSTVSGRSAPIIETYGWSNGNMTSINDGTSTHSLEYHTDKPNQQGDWLSLMNLGRTGFDYTLIMKNKNLVKKYDGSVLEYGFDAEGRINVVHRDNYQFHIEYECR